MKRRQDKTMNTPVVSTALTARLVTRGGGWRRRQAATRMTATSGDGAAWLVWVAAAVKTDVIITTAVDGNRSRESSKLVSIRNNRNWIRLNSLIWSIFWYFFRKFKIFPVILVCFGFFRNSLFWFSCFTSIPKQRVSMFRFNRNKQNTNRNSLIESIFWYFYENLGLFRFVSDCFETVLLVSIVSI